MRIPRYRRLLCAMLAACLITMGTSAQDTPSAFPVASPESQGMDAGALEQLAAVVQGYIDDELALGAELLVIKNRRTVLHRAFGWKDRESDQPMETDTIFNIRSMSKPFTGAALQVLIDRGQISPEDLVTDYLLGFDNDLSRRITVEHVLTHRSGLPLSIFMTRGVGLDHFESLQAMANAVGEDGPEFEIGEKFWYSDSGTDVVGALVEIHSGLLLNDFWEREFFAPLGMRDTLVALDAEDPRYPRIASLYIGSPHAWSRFWSPEVDPLYPFAWGSQTIYSTPRDYAKFLAMWMDGGTVGEHQLLSPEAIERTLTPVSEMKMLGSDARFPTDYTGVEPWYGQMAQLWMPTDDPTGSDPVIIGHSGSDGTVALAWPAEDLMVLYFTQSRGGTTVLKLEEHVDRLLLHQERVDEAEAVPEALQRYLGTYVANFASFREVEFEVLYKNGHLAVDIPGQLVFELAAPDADGRRQFLLTDAVAVSFDETDDGTVTGMTMYQAGQTFDLPKGRAKTIVDPPLDLELAERLVGTYTQERDGATVEITVSINNGNLAFKPPDVPMPLDLYTPDDEGRWMVRLDTSVRLRFDENEAGEIVSLTILLPGDRNEVFQRHAADEGASPDDAEDAP